MPVEVDQLLRRPRESREARRVGQARRPLRVPGYRAGGGRVRGSPWCRLTGTRLYLASRTARKLAQPDAYADYPRQIHAVLNELRDGEVEVRFRHQGLNELISKVDILANRLVFAILISALIVGSSLLGVFSEAGVRILGVNIFGLVGFLFAAVPRPGTPRRHHPLRSAVAALRPPERRY